MRPWSAGSTRRIGAPRARKRWGSRPIPRPTQGRRPGLRGPRHRLARRVRRAHLDRGEAPPRRASTPAYEIIGWRLRWRDSALAVRHRAPDARWFGAACRSWSPRSAVRRRPKLIPRVDAAAHAYPWAGEYTMWPGPNSNTFTAWVLRAVPGSGPTCRRPRSAKDYSGKEAAEFRAEREGRPGLALRPRGVLPRRRRGFE